MGKKVKLEEKVKLGEENKVWRKNEQYNCLKELINLITISTALKKEIYPHPKKQQQRKETYPFTKNKKKIKTVK